MSTIVLVDAQQVGANPQEICNRLAALSSEVKTDVEALEASTGGLDYKNTVSIATTTTLPANTRTGNVLLADANGLLGTIDGVDTATLTLPFRALVKDEATGANNGIYSFTSIGGVSSKWTATRTTDADTSAEVTPNMQVPVELGTANGGLTFRLTNTGTVTLNTTALTFADVRNVASSAPADVTKAAAAVGTSKTLARSDHKHDISTAAPATVGVANAEGSATSLARSDHVHNNGNQRFQLTLSSGTAAKTTGVVVTANTRAVVSLVTPGAGVSGTRYAFAYSVGIAGVGSITVTAKDSAAGNNTVATDNSILDIIAFEAPSV